MYDIIIVGAGPAGLTAALYGARSNKKILVLEANQYGGQIINSSIVENYPGLPSVNGYDFATNLYKQVIDLGVEIKFEAVLKVDEEKNVYTKDNKYTGKSIILAIGSKNRKLNIENEEKLLGKGVSYCATCDGNFYKDKTVMIVGGGDTALEDALYLSDIVKKLYIIHRRESFSGQKILQEKINKKSNIECIFNSNVIKINGIEKVESVIIKDNNENEKEIEIDGLFIAVGQEPNNYIFNNVVDLDEKGYIISPDDVHTKTKGIYVAGDARVKFLRQLTTAVSDGSIAATMAIKEME